MNNDSKSAKRGFVLTKFHLGLIVFVILLMLGYVYLYGKDKGKQEESAKEITPTITPTLMPTSTPTKQPTSTKKPIHTSTIMPNPNYEDLNCPKIIKVEDSLGNSKNGSFLNSSFKKGTVNTLTVRVTATDPNNKTLYYSFTASGGFSNGIRQEKDWSTDDFFTVNVNTSLLGAMGNIIDVNIDNRDGYGCNGTFDRMGYWTYDIIPQ